MVYKSSIHPICRIKHRLHTTSAKIALLPTEPKAHGHFAEFEKCFGKKPDGTSKRTDQGDEGRFRCYSRDQISKRGDNLDISWLKDENATHHDDLPEPTELAALIREKLSIAMEEMDALSAILEGIEDDAATS